MGSFYLGQEFRGIPASEAAATHVAVWYWPNLK
jgi:hypothetical protein